MDQRGFKISVGKVCGVEECVLKLYALKVPDEGMALRDPETVLLRCRPFSESRHIQGPLFYGDGYYLLMASRLIKQQQNKYLPKVGSLVPRPYCNTAIYTRAGTPLHMHNLGQTGKHVDS